MPFFDTIAAMHLLDGKKLAEQIRAKIRAEQMPRTYTPTLAVMLVGDDPASKLYVHMKQKVAEELGLRVEINHFPVSTPMSELVRTIQAWNQDDSIHGILVQVPLPPGHDESTIIQEIDPSKDVDGFHPQTIAALEAGNPTLLSPVHEGILLLLNQAPVHINGARVALIGNSDIFAKPLARLLTTAGTSVRIMHAHGLDVNWLKEADIVIIAIGQAGFLKPEQVRDDAVIIDVGTTRDQNQKVHGDADLQAFKNTSCWITPVPGGVGPMTIALLMQNLVRCAERQESSR